MNPDLTDEELKAILVLIDTGNIHTLAALRLAVGLADKIEAVIKAREIIRGRG